MQRQRKRMFLPMCGTFMGVKQPYYIFYAVNVKPFKIFEVFLLYFSYSSSFIVEYTSL